MPPNETKLIAADRSPSSPKEHLLEIEHLGLTLGGARILDDVTLDLWPGYAHALVGPNGAGKSTLASIIMGLSGYRDHEGDLRLRGVSLRGRGVDERARLGITMAWQEPARYEGLSVRDFVAAGAADGGPGASEALAQVGLDPSRYLDRRVDRSLSGGERKRIELASILTMRPALVLMDEPDSGIDVEALRRIFDAIRALREQGATVILITHSRTVLGQADHAFLLCGGCLVDKGAPDRVASQYEQGCEGCPRPNRPIRSTSATASTEEGLP